MLFTTGLAMLASIAQHEKPPAIQERLTGVFSNEEQVYFETDAGRTAPPALSLKIEEIAGVMTVSQIDAYGTALSKPQSITISIGDDRDIVTVGTCSRFFERGEDSWIYSKVQNRKLCQQKYQIVKISDDGLTMRMTDGAEIILKRARSVECWAAVPKKVAKEDGGIDWYFARQLSMHDQGGRVRVGGGDTGADEIILRMRAVYWPPPSTNRPSLVLYVHKPDDPDRAISYSWADINASRVGINLRSMQASCTVIGSERPSDVTKTNFRG